MSLLAHTIEYPGSLIVQ